MKRGLEKNAAIDSARKLSSVAEIVLRALCHERQRMEAAYG